MKDHEAKHNPPILETVEPSVVIDTSISDDKKDDFFYQKALLEHGMLVLNFWDAMSESDGERIMRSWKLFMLY